MTKRKFYRSVFTVEVLSEEPLESDLTLDSVAYMITEGDCSGFVNEELNQPIDGAKCAELLQQQGSDPEFFGIDEEGNDAEEG